MYNQTDLSSLLPELCRNSLKYYIKYMMPEYQFNWHHIEMIERLEAVERGEIKRLAIFMPPRCSKSQTVSQLFPPWYFGRNPTKKIIQTGYNQTLVEDFGGYVRNQMKDDEKYHHIFPDVEVADDSKSKSKFGIKRHGGTYFATGVGGPLTGRGGDIITIDDPVKNHEEVLNPDMREKAWTWYQSTLYTRLMPGGSIILVNTRWHSDDLAGRILANDPYGKWEVVSFPAISEQGKALWPAFYDVDTLLETKQTIGPYQWAAQYMQDPIIDGGNIIKQAWFRYYGLPPEFKFKVWSIDTAVKTGTENDYSVAQLWGEAENGYYLIKQIRGKWEFPELQHKLTGLFSEYPADEILIEDTSSGQQLVQSFKAFTTFPIIAMHPGKNMPKMKEERLHLAAPSFEAGNVFFPEKTEWVFDLKDELVGFPFKKHDDMVDATTQALFRFKQRKDRRRGIVVPMPLSAGKCLKYN